MRRPYEDVKPWSGDLAPCPFCGSDDAGLVQPTCYPSTPYNPADRLYPLVGCGTCSASVEGKNEDYKGTTAAEAWNRRATAAPHAPERGGDDG